MRDAWYSLDRKLAIGPGRILEVTMRTTLTIPDDVMAAARQRAEATGQTIGEALGELARRGLQTELAEEQESDFWRGVKFLPARPGEPEVTTDLVNELLEESP
jgi:hypothetical protein